MSIKFDINKFPNGNLSPQLLAAFLKKIYSGKAIMFTGAGFSIGATNVMGEEPPLAKKLAEKICCIGKFDIDEDLRFASDYFMKNCDKGILIDLLKKSYTLNNVTEAQETICQINWRRFYTTNYDKSIELAASKKNKLVECIDLHHKPDQNYKKNSICVHLNGSIDSLSEDSIENEFKLATSSYITSDSFLNSSWCYPFKQDLERCSAIVFVGYSLYDIEIQKLLFENSDFKEKTYFITKETSLSAREKFTLEQFGTILPIGTNGFANLISKNLPAPTEDTDDLNLEALMKYSISFASENIRDSQIESMLMYGDVRQQYIDNAVVGSQKKPYLILRECLPKILEFCNNFKNTVIFGEFGNGKSLLINELLPYLSVNSFDVYTIVDQGGDYIGDIEKLAKSASKSIIIVDGYEKYLNLLQHSALLSSRNIQLIVTCRTSDHERLRPALKRIDFQFSEINIDLLTNEEMIFFIKILDNQGMWGGAANLPPERKQKYLTHDSQMQISLALLALLNSPQMINRVKTAIEPIFINKLYKATIFAIALLEILDLPVTSSLISEVAINDSIYESNFRQNESFTQLFKLQNNKIVSKSSLFCLSIINNHFDPSYVMDRLQKIASKFDLQKNNSKEEKIIFKAMLKFSFVERLIPDTNKKNNLYRYYEELKTSVPWLIKDPHYWLQYGMARIPFKDYQKAQLYFDHAYGLAKNKYDYYTNNIDTQQARLFLLKGIQEVGAVEAYDFFSKAHRLLSTLDDDVYKFRQVEMYRDFFDKHFKVLTKGSKVDFKRACERMVASIKNAEIGGVINLAEQKKISKVKDDLNNILGKIS